MSVLRDFLPLGRSVRGDTYFETGLCRGASFRHAAELPFGRLVACDVVGEYVESGRREFAADPRVELFRGASPDAIRALCRPWERTVFYLDAHYSGPGEEGMDGRYGQCPLLAEIAAIGEIPWDVPSVVIVDDWHMFADPWDKRLFAQFDPFQWPTAADIVKRLPGRELVRVGHLAYFLPR